MAWSSCGSGVRVSLIVCTRNRASRLPDFFARLALLEPPRGGCELILVDHGSADATPAQIKMFAPGAPFPVRSLRIAVPGLTRAKNLALAHAQGDFIAFTDDDCYPRPDYLRAWVEVFKEHRIGVAGGRVVLHDPSDARVSVKDVETAMDIAPQSFVPAGIIHGANMAVTREVVRAIGGFDPLFGPGTPCAAAEDIEYIARAVWAGRRGRYDPRPVVAHHHGRKPGRDTEMYMHGYDYGRGAYYTKFVLNSQARSAYLRHWYRATQRQRWRRLRRELVGGRRYLVQRIIHPERIPQFPK